MRLLLAMLNVQNMEACQKYCGFQGPQALGGVWGKAPEKENTEVLRPNV